MRPNWMTETDYRILEFFVETGFAFTPKGVAFNVEGITYHQAANSIRRLREHGLLGYPETAPDGVDESGIYRPTEIGGLFVSGEVTLKELRSKGL